MHTFQYIIVLPPESERLRTRTTCIRNEKFENIFSRNPNAQHVVRVCLCYVSPALRHPYALSFSSLSEAAVKAYRVISAANFMLLFLF